MMHSTSTRDSRCEDSDKLQCWESTGQQTASRTDIPSGSHDCSLAHDEGMLHSWQTSTSPDGDLECAWARCEVTTSIALPRSVIKASPEQLRPAACEERCVVRLVEAELRTKLVNFDEFSGHRFEDITNGKRPPPATEDEKTIPEAPPEEREASPNGWSSSHWERPRFQVKIPTKMRCSRTARRHMVMGSAREWKTKRHLKTQTDTTEDIDPEVKRRVNRCASPDTTSSAGRNRVSSLGLLLPQETSSAPARGSGGPGSVNQNGEDMSELVPVFLAQRKKNKELDLKDSRWQTERRETTRDRRIQEGRWKLWSRMRKPGFLFHSRSHVSCVPAYHNGLLQPRSVLTFRQ